MNILTLEQLLILHAMVIEATGGSDGLRDLGRLESVIASQTQAVFGVELYADVYLKAAALIKGIIGDHPFVDGNKRTGMLAGLAFLEINNYQFTCQQGELEDFAVDVATQKLEISNIADWLQAHTQARA